MTSQKPPEQRTSSTRAYSTTRCCTVSFSVPLRPGAAEPPAWVCTSPFPEATLCSTWRQHCNGTRPAEIPAALTWGCWQHGLNNLCWDSLGLQLKTEPRPTWTQFASHHSRNRNFFFLLRRVRCLTVQRSSAVSCTLCTIKFGCPKSTRFGHRQ